MQPVLSICIPTYNFGRYIAETLDSIVCQLTGDVEVVVVDGASTDDTPDILRRYQNHYPNVRYHRLKEKGGIDRDMATSVSLAGGEYCWLFSSDDVMEDGAIAKMVKETAYDYDLYLCKHLNCTLDMTLIGEHPVLRSPVSAVFDLANQSDRRRYFGLAENTEAFFSFMGGIIIKKRKWESVQLNEMFAGSCWAHVARIIELMEKGLRVKYLAEPLLSRRGGNDSFADKGLVNRYRIAIDGYHKIGDVFFGHESFEAFHLRRAIRNEFKLKDFLYAKRRCAENPEGEDRRLLDTLVRKTLSDWSLSSKIKYLLYKMMPIKLYLIVRRIYRWLFK